MDDRCLYCSGYGTVPSPYTGDTHRIECPKCQGVGRPARVVMVGSATLQEALENLRTIQGDAMETYTVPYTASPSGPNRQQKRRMARGKR